MSAQPIPQPGDFQYIKLPDGSYGKFAASASDDQIKSAISKDFPAAFSQSPGGIDAPNKYTGLSLLQRLKVGAQDNSPMPGSFEGHPENIGEYVPATVGRAAEGAVDISRGNVALGTHHIIQAAMNAVTPMAPLTMAAAPATALRALAGGYAGGKITSGAAQLMGASPDQQALSGDVGSLAGGFTAGTGLLRALLGTPTKELVAKYGSDILDLLEPRKALIRKIKSIMTEGNPPPTVQAPGETGPQPTAKFPNISEAPPPSQSSSVPQTEWPPVTPSAITPSAAMTPAQLRDILETRGIQEAMREDLERHGQSALSQERRTFFAGNAPGASKTDLIQSVHEFLNQAPSEAPAITQARADATTVVQPKTPFVIQTPADLIKALQQMAAQKGRQ